MTAGPIDAGIRLVSNIGLGLLVVLSILSACSKGDPYVPPDPFYYFASYPVGKNPTTVTTADFNRDQITDLITTNISSNTVSLLFGNGDGSNGDGSGSGNGTTNSNTTNSNTSDSSTGSGSDGGEGG